MARVFVVLEKNYQLSNSGSIINLSFLFFSFLLASSPKMSQLHQPAMAIISSTMPNIKNKTANIQNMMPNCGWLEISVFQIPTRQATTRKSITDALFPSFLFMDIISSCLGYEMSRYLNLSSLSSYGNAKNLFGARVPQDAGAFFHGGAGGVDIIHQKNLFVFYFGRIFD